MIWQVGFRVQKAVKKVAVHKKSNDIINRLNRTKKEEFPNFAALREEFDAGVCWIPICSYDITAWCSCSYQRLKLLKNV